MNFSWFSHDVVGHTVPSLEGDQEGGGAEGTSACNPTGFRGTKKRTNGEINKLLHLAPPESKF